MAAIVEPIQPVSDFKVPARIVSYPAVSTALETAKEYYNWSKEASPVVAYAEAKVEGGIQWLAPRVEPILESAKPYLLKADGLGSVALDTVEVNAQRLADNCGSAKEAFEQRVVQVDQFLKDSLVAKPLNLALDATQKMVDQYYPQEGEKKVESVGPIAQTAYLSKRIQEQAFLKLHTLSLRAPEKLNGMEYTVDLIKYAQEVLDNGVQSLNQAVSKGLQTGSTLIKEAPKEVREKIQNAAQDALAAIHTASQVISKQFPSDLSLKFTQLREAAAKTETLILFSSVAVSSSKLLQETGTSISAYLLKGEEIPHQLLSSTYSNLHKVLESLLSFVDASNKSIVESKPIPSDQ